MQVIRGRCFEVDFAAVLAHDRLTDLMHGAQVEDKMVSRLDWLVAVLANELQNTTNASYNKSQHTLQTRTRLATSIVTSQWKCSIATI